MAVRIALLDDYQHVASTLGDWSAIPDAGVVPFHDHVSDPDDLVGRLDGFDVVVAMRERTPLPSGVLNRLPALKLIVTTGMANAVIDLEAAAARGVTVCGTSGNVTSTVGADLGADPRPAAPHPRGGRRGAGGAMAADRRNRPRRAHPGPRRSRPHRLAGGPGGPCLRHGGGGLEPEPHRRARAEEAGAEAVTKKELFATADVVSVHYVLSERQPRPRRTPRTSRRMKPTAVLVNTSRGPLVDEAALVEALEARRLAGAGLDTFDTEPLPADHPLRRLPSPWSRRIWGTSPTTATGSSTTTSWRTSGPGWRVSRSGSWSLLPATDKASQERGPHAPWPDETAARRNRRRGRRSARHGRPARRVCPERARRRPDGEPGPAGAGHHMTRTRR